ncbi:hypothetical protein TraAM80_05956 [Trypanosoma rangeli]|uniref:Peroxin-13 n=1 Tax=Trypanosoma rangeli TaxID=5698 RepID=A0A422NCL6_TRYRA|nr:uncharacterized protein TraAM80_05956 [Trypanosoma rangeli]RNF03250.1 hypothetical protein TraAM80_05956 [Trypanosoma rangeli]|eukprot:RNF03250.1 hypothetical protein TraAM80_05956 [Trypanosoma rangeli]
MTALTRPWENAAESLPSSPVTNGTTAVAHQSPTVEVSATSPSNALTTQSASAKVAQSSLNSSKQVLSGNNTTASANRYASGYNSGTGYNGLGMGGMYGGLGMGSMYGGLGMGGMYGGLGMGGMYGGLGMGGMYGGLGMGMGMSEDFQRSQMTFMLLGRLLEMCGMFAGVIQMTFGSALQFMGNYIGMSQQYNQLKSGMYMDESGKWVQLPKRSLTDKDRLNTSHKRRYASRKRRERPWVATLRRIIFFLLAVFIARRLMVRAAAGPLSLPTS